VTAAEGPRANADSFIEHFYRLPSRLLPDPIGAMIEKEFRFLTRSPRFRLVFLMGFSFGLIVWMPVMMRSRHDVSAYNTHFLTAVTVYSLMLLGEVLIWNVFGFDRSAVQVYFAAPVRMTQVLAAKNITAIVFILLEAVAITLICMAFRLPITPRTLAEAITVTLTMSIYLLAIGNILSVRNPRAVDPEQSWRRSAAGKVQTLLIFIYLLVAAPVALAYAARYALESDVAFYAVLLFDALVGVVMYWVAMESALQTATHQKETIISALSQSSGPIG
jgi:ABC-2 type transport system permease protein